MSANEFVSIRVSTLRGDQKIAFDVYVKIAGKHILYCRKGDSFEGERLKRLKDKKLKQMFISEGAEKEYRNYLAVNIDSAYEGSKGQPIEVRSQVIQGAQQAAAEDLMDDPESTELYNIAKSGTGRYVDFIFKNQDALRAILDIENTDRSVGHHGVTVATYAIGMGEVLGWKDFTDRMTALAMGCMVHDIEHQYTGINIGKKVPEYTEEEAKSYYNHPEHGALRISELKHWDSLVLNIVRQHHEKINGEGFPRGLREKELDPWVLACSTANAYDRIVTFEGATQKEALRRMLVESIGFYPLNQLKALQVVLQKNGVT